MKRIAVAVLLLHLVLLVALLMFGNIQTPKLLPVEISLEQDRGDRRSEPSAATASADASASRAASKAAPSSSVSVPSLSPTANTKPSSVTPSNTVSLQAPPLVSESETSATRTANAAQGIGDRQPMVDASYSGNQLPEYPAMSRRLGEQGTVVLRVMIGADGSAGDVEVIRSSGSARLDRAAIDTIRQWRFVPAAKGGKPVAAWYEWQWEFRLR